MNSLTRNKKLLSIIVNKNLVIRTLLNSSPNVVKSKIPNIEISNTSLDEYVWRNLDKWHDKTAIECAETGRNYSYSDIYKKSKFLKNILISSFRLKPNDTVAVILPNVPEYPIILLGAIEAGLKVTTINPIYTSDEIRKQLVNSETKLVFTLNELWSKSNQAIQDFKYKVPVIVIDDKNNQSAPTNAIKFEEILNKCDQNDYRIESNFDDVILLPYSSGTTGVPKGVELTNKSVISNLHQMRVTGFRIHNETEGSYQEVVPVFLPMFHIYGLMVITLNMLSSGCKLVTLPKFTSQGLINILENHRPSLLFAAPPLALLLTGNPQVTSKHLSTVNTIMSAAAPLGATDVERLNEKCLNKTKIIQAYGLTEASPLTHVQTNHYKGGVKLGGCGLLIPQTECKVVSSDGHSSEGLGPKQSGELLIRGPQIMKGYFKNKEATEDVIDSDGWLRTGDVGYYDEEDQFFITDRLKELIKVKGYQVAPAELEEVLRCYPDIEDVAVVGVPHNKYGEVPKAFVVPKENVKLNCAQVEKFVESKVASYKKLVGGVVVIDKIPKNPSGKILRRLLKDF